MRPAWDVPRRAPGWQPSEVRSPVSAGRLVLSAEPPRVSAGSVVSVEFEVSSVVSTTMIGEPSETRSPTLTLSSFTTPVSVAGTSIEALSDSMVMSESSTFTLSPGLTITSMTSTFSKSPISGSLMLTSAPITSHRRRIGFFRIDIELLDRLRHPRGRDLLVVGEALQRRERDVVTIDLKEVAQPLPIVAAPEAVRA